MISKTKSKKSFAKLLLSLACVLCMAFSVVIPVNAEAANKSKRKSCSGKNDLQERQS